MSRQVCQGTRKDGACCETVATADGYCFAHSEALQERTRQARATGGRNSSKTVRARKAMKAEASDIARTIEDALAAVATGTMRPQQGTAIAALAGAWIRLHEHGEFETRLAALEERAQATGARRRGW